VIELEIKESKKHCTLPTESDNSIPPVAIPAFQRSCNANYRCVHGAFVKWQAFSGSTTAAAPTYALSTRPNNGEKTQPIGVRNVNGAHKCSSRKQQHVIELEIN
jgi:hypothetical protein